MPSILSGSKESRKAKLGYDDGMTITQAVVLASFIPSAVFLFGALWNRHTQRNFSAETGKWMLSGS